MKAFILAAGFGTRLWPLTEDRTKAAIPFLNRPLIAYSVEYLASHGIRDIIVNLHHQPDSIRRALGDGSKFGVNISYSFEEQILGTSGALDPVRESLLDDDFLVINGKIITNIDLGRAIAAHRRQKALATLVLKENVLREHFSIVEVDDRSWITRFAGFPDAVSSQAVSAYAITGQANVVTKNGAVLCDYVCLPGYRVRRHRLGRNGVGESGEARNPTPIINFYYAEVLAQHILFQDQRGQGLLSAMCGNRTAKVDVGD